MHAIHIRRFTHLAACSGLAMAALTLTPSAQASTRFPWPEAGQTAVSIDGARNIETTGPVDTAQPIASVAKVMTAYVVLTDHPLREGEQGPVITVSSADAADYRHAVRTGESAAAVRAGERITERQALQAMLLPSANNVARTLARWDAGSIRAFTARENQIAARLGMTHSRYTDPSGLQPSTVSTAPDQLRLARTALELPAFAQIVAEPQADIPVAGTVHNTNQLLGHDGVIGVKTGYTSQSGACLVFAALLTGPDGSRHMIYGATLGQPGGSKALSSPGGPVDRMILAVRGNLAGHERR
jgi:D-alanyl-D-alanine carboxypeptidase (penicillin-binding protein 5/6)